MIYAAFWEVYRTPYSSKAAGPAAALWKSTDGGETWKDLSKNPGMPKGLMGRVGVSVSPANPQRVYALIEAEEGGAFKSDNGGDTWVRTNSHNDIRQRAWYYTHVFADPKNADTVYYLNTGFYRSTDGGRTFTAIQTPHGDNHGLWIAPNDPQRMIESNDGGANVTLQRRAIPGRRIMNQPTAQFYRVALDNDFPYHAYGAQQDNSTVRTATRGRGGITEKDWYDVGGGESGWIAPDLRDTNVVYAGSYGNLITRFDARTGIQRNINPWPDNPMGHPASDLKYRFQWSFPIVISPHDPTVIYAGANVMFKSTDEGQSWTPISGDLTRNDKSRQGSSGGPITKDNTSIEYYDTIFTINESPITKGLIWVGSDDGLVHLDARRRQDLDECDSAERHHAGMGADQRDRPFAVRSGDGVRRGDDVQIRRFQAVHVQDHRLRQDVDQDRQRHSRRSFHARGSRRSESQGPAVRRNGIRHLCFLRFGRPLAVDPAQSADRADHRSGVSTSATMSWWSRRRAARSGSWTIWRLLWRSERRGADGRCQDLQTQSQRMRAEGGGAAAAESHRRARRARILPAAR